MTNNNISSQGRLFVDCMYANLYLWFVVHSFLLRQCMLGYRRFIVKQCVIGNHRVIIYEKFLAQTHPEYFAYLSRFSDKYDIYLQENRRDKNCFVYKERRKCSFLISCLTILFINSYAIAGNAVNYTNNNSTSEQQELKYLLNWVRYKMSQLDFEVGYELPKIERLSRAQMVRLAFGDKVNRVSSQLAANVFGLYNYENETIYLLNSIDIGTTKGKAILLHELVHYLQYQNGHDEQVECHNRLEYLAYTLEAAYLREHGEQISFSQNHIRRVMQCNI